jgi:hypothetical protein
MIYSIYFIVQREPFLSICEWLSVVTEACVVRFENYIWN